MGNDMNIAQNKKRELEMDIDRKIEEIKQNIKGKQSLGSAR